MNRETIEEKSSGEEAPAAMRVAPAMSGGMLKCVAMTFSAGTSLYLNIKIGC
jgi:hypothetical protein